MRAARLRLRHEDGSEFTQSEVAAVAGMTQAAFSKIERGKQYAFTAEQLDELASALDEDPYYLFTGNQPQPMGALAAQIDRMVLDHWGEDAVLTVARQEAKRVREQGDQELAFNAAVEKLIAAGLDRSTAETAARAMLTQPRGGSPESQGAAPGEQDQRATGRSS